RDLMRSLAAVNRGEWAGKLNKALPYLLVCGADDPVGDYGKGVKTVQGRMLAAGCSNTQLKIYDGIRHEPHNERNRMQFFNDIACWLDAAVGGNAENKSV
ncbi:MAG: alpha/beta hydrolase, partial [Oscillospiraceae bacterium]|nr:alpha/beta hydrolase [Oscillospiraceae bacterium]